MPLRGERRSRKGSSGARDARHARARTALFVVRLTSKSHDGDHDFLAIGSGRGTAAGDRRGTIRAALQRAFEGMRREASPRSNRTLRARRGRTAPPLRMGSRTERAGGGRYQTRTDDLFRVKEARYQLRQSPSSAGPSTAATGCPRHRASPCGRVTRRPGAGLKSPPIRGNRLESCRARWEQCGKCGCSAVVAHNLAKVRVASSSLVIRSSAGVRLNGPAPGVNPYGGVAERRGSGLQSRPHGFESRRHLVGAIDSTPGIGGDWRSGSALP